MLTIGHTPARRSCYDSAFFDDIAAGAMRSAEVIVPLVLSLTGATSVVDVGCGRGIWLRAFQDFGVTDVLGIDGDYVDRDTLLIPADSFVAADLSRELTFDRAFDLAVCLEVAEHLPARSARRLIRTLTNLSPCILFSAAVPGQKGTNHLNEQWPWYWRMLFAERGFRQLNPIRSQIFHETSVDQWYRQNIFVYASDAALRNSPGLQAEAQRSRSGDLEPIQGRILAPYTTLPGLLRMIPSACGAAIRRFVARW